MFLSDNQIAYIFTTTIEDLQKALQQEREHNQKNFNLTVSMVQSLQETFENRMNNEKKFGDLTEDEKNEAFKIFRTCLLAAPGWHDLPQQLQQTIIAPQVLVIHQQTKHIHHHHHRHHLDPIDWMVLGAMFSGHHHHHDHDCCPWFKSSTNQSDEKTVAILLFIGLILLAISILCLVLIALYFLITCLLDCGERFFWREGRIQAILPIAVAMATGVAAGILSSMLLVSPMMSLGVFLGLSNPIGLIIAGSIVLGILTAALAALITKGIQNKIIEKLNPDALDAHDPYRYALSPAEREHLEKNDFDCIAVTCAIVALRTQLGKKGIPSYFSRPFTEDMRERNIILEKIRKLRRGKEDEITIEKSDKMPALTFKLKIERTPSINPEIVSNSFQPTAPPNENFQNSFLFFQPSVSPYDPEGIYDPNNGYSEQF